ncbi:cysteine desulfurase [Clostridia bacterium]|nr:cysteine desulfurase [Clostridia bacterium]
MKSVIYFDTAAAAKPCAASLAELSRVCVDTYGNPAALHGMGIRAEEVIARSKAELLAHLPFAHAGDIVFTSGATESNNLAVNGAVNALAKANRGGVVITTGVEHKSVSVPFAALDGAGGGYDKLVLSPVDCKHTGNDRESERSRADREGETLRKDGACGVAGYDGCTAFTDYIIDKINEHAPRVFFVSVIAVNNETGAVIDVARVCAAAKRANRACVVHTDFAAGFLKYDLRGRILRGNNGCSGQGLLGTAGGDDCVPDLITVSALKCGGVGGIGGLYVRRGTRLVPQIVGGGHQRGIRSGTEPTALIAAFDAAAREYVPASDGLSRCLADGLCRMDNVRLNGVSDYIVNFSFVGVKAETLVHFLEERGIYVSAGSSCNSKSIKNEVLLNYGIPAGLADTAVRVSFCNDNTVGEVAELLAALEAARVAFRV